MKIYTEINGSGQDIVILHGWGCNHYHMRSMANHLAKHFRVTNVNLPGSGLSDWGNIKNINDIADAVLTVLPESAIYIGWSFGGLVAASIAALYPERVKRFIGIATTPKFVEDDNWPGLPKPGFKAGFSVTNKQEFEALLRGFIDVEFIGFDPKPAGNCTPHQISLPASAI
jgi:pimeloyl-[acyl-carrier protein] methyl ester esterase